MPAGRTTSSSASSLSVFDAHAGARATSATFLLGQVMFLVAVALGFTAAGTYIGRDLSFGTAEICEFVSFGMLIVQMFVAGAARRVDRDGLAVRAGPAAGAGLGPVIAEYATTIDRRRSTRPPAGPR